MIGGEIFVLYMGSANILEIAKLASKSNNPKIKEIGLKAGEKLYEELVTELEAKRTIKLENYFLIIPETFELLPERIKTQYKKYDLYPKLNKPIRSDDFDAIRLDFKKLMLKDC